jgi:hypothetical protein
VVGALERLAYTDVSEYVTTRKKAISTSREKKKLPKASSVATVNPELERCRPPTAKGLLGAPGTATLARAG